MRVITASTKVQQDGHTLGTMFWYQGLIYRLETFLPNERILGRAMAKDADTELIEIDYQDAEWSDHN